MFRFLAVLTMASMTGLQPWRTLFNNFAVEVAHLEGNHIGMIQSVREIPGFLALLAIFIILIIREHRLSGLSIFTMGLGVAITGFFPSYTGLIFTTLVMSFGFHYYETTNQSLTLQYFDQQTSPWVFGKLRSYAAATNIGIGIVIFAMTAVLSYLQIYLALGLVIVAAVIWGLFQNPTRKDIVPQRKKRFCAKNTGCSILSSFWPGRYDKSLLLSLYFCWLKNLSILCRK